MPFLGDMYGNPGNIHKLGRAAADAVASAREQVADFLHASPEQIIFTSGGSEANNLAIRTYRKSGSGLVAASAIEHDSVRNTLSAIRQERGLRVSYIYPDQNGVITADAVKSEAGWETALVSVMYVNNETGAVNEVPEIGTICRARGTLFHTDCVQAAGTLDLDVDKLNCDLLSISSHKLHGPKGVGALYVRDRSLISPLIYGGADQEFGLRGGTENVAGIVGFGEACRLAKLNLKENAAHISTLRQLFWQKLRERLDEHGLSGICHINGPSIIQPGKILNLRFDGVDAETLVVWMDARDVCISAGSACRSHEQEPSHVLTAMGLTAEEAMQSVRVSFSDTNTVDETLRAAEIMADCAMDLKEIGG